jgi:hypothetical protein
MSSIILASLAVPLMIVATALIVDRIDQSTAKKASDENRSKKNNDEQKGPPDDLIDLSGGMYGI